MRPLEIEFDAGVINFSLNYIGGNYSKVVDGTRNSNLKIRVNFRCPGGIFSRERSPSLSSRRYLRGCLPQKDGKEHGQLEDPTKCYGMRMLTSISFHIGNQWRLRTDTLKSDRNLA